jgi:hypothetical protein
MSSPYEFVYRGAFSFPLSPRQMWQELERPDRLTGRWRWVDVRRVDPTLEQGAELTCVIKPPVPVPIMRRLVTSTGTPAARSVRRAHVDSLHNQSPGPWATAPTEYSVGRRRSDSVGEVCDRRAYPSCQSRDFAGFSTDSGASADRSSGVRAWRPW